MNDVYNSHHDERFDTRKYCYHYTSSDAALKIINGDSLKLSDPTNTNDTNEEKDNLQFVGQKNGNDQEYYDVIKDLRSHVRMLCVCRDSKRSKKPDFPKDDNRYFIEMSHRGFSNPKMWSEYGEKNKGVCFIFDEEKLKALIKADMKTALISSKFVKYQNKYDPYTMPYDNVEKLKVGHTKRNSIGALATSMFLRDNRGYTDYMFFWKNEDWANENEYRYLVVTDEPSPVFISGVLSCVAGIVVGEKIDDEKLKAIKLMIKNMLEKHHISKDIPIRRISFRNGTYLSEV